MHLLEAGVSQHAAEGTPQLDVASRGRHTGGSSVLTVDTEHSHLIACR